MSGLVPADASYTNFYVTGNLAYKSKTTNVFVPPRPDVIYLPVSSSYVLTPTSAETVVFILNGELDSNISVDIDNTNAFIGQEMIWMFTNNSSSQITIQTSSNFLINYSISIDAGQKLAQYWLYTENGWGFSIENC